MALLLSTKLQTGVVAEYWRIKEVHIQMDEGRIRIDLELYLGAKEREGGSSPVLAQSLTIQDTLADILKDQLLSAVYTGAKNTGVLGGAVDTPDVAAPAVVKAP